MNLAFLIDPPEKLHVEKDTSFALMLEAQKRGHTVYVLERGDLSLSAGKLMTFARKALVADNPEKPFEFRERTQFNADFFDILFVRTDPPFDTGYLTDTWLLSHAGKRPVVLNSPEGLRTINEKIWAAQLTSVTPATLITADLSEFKAFLENHRKIVIKPTDGFGGSAIFMLASGDKNAVVTFETLRRASGYVIVQEYLPAAVDGDKRILLLEGEILGAVLRYHGSDDHRNNFAAGGKAREATITENDRKICGLLKPHLQGLGIFFAGIDIIGDKLVEVNVTSPTCLREMQKYYRENLAEKVIMAAEKRHAGN